MLINPTKNYAKQDDIAPSKISRLKTIYCKTNYPKCKKPHRLLDEAFQAEVMFSI